MDDQGVQDAAILLMSIGEEAAAQVFRHLEPKEVQRIGEAMAAIRTLPKERVESVMQRFGEEAGQQPQMVPNASGYVKAVITRALGEDKATMFLDRILQVDQSAGIENLKWMSPEAIIELIGSEHPQIIASILVHLERDVAGAVLGALEKSVRADVTLRIATLDGIRPSALRELNDVLAKLLVGSGERVRQAPMGGVKAAAEILAHVAGKNEVDLMEALREADAEVAQKIEDQMFTFEDLLKLDDRAIQTVLRELQTDSLLVALKGSTTEVRDKIFKNMSQRAAQTLREDLDSKGPVRLSEVEAQQKEIMQTVKRLADDGQIQLASGPGGDAFV